MTVPITHEEMMSNIGLDFFDEKLEVVAFVTETLTSITQNDTSMTDLKKDKFKLEVLAQPEVAKPGLKYNALVSKLELWFG